MARKKEGLYTKPLVDGICAAGGWAAKIPDPVGCYTTVSRPFDVFGVWVDGSMIAIECKWMKEPAAFGKRHLEDHQIEALDECLKRKALTFVVLFTKYKNRIHMLVWRWSVFRVKTQSYGKAFLINAIERGASTVTRKDIFPANWLREATKHLK